MKNSIIFILIAGILFIMTGCSESVHEPKLSSVIQDDGMAPVSPKWYSDPYSVDNVTEDRFNVTVRWHKVDKNTNNQLKKNVVGYKILKFDSEGILISTFLVPVRDKSDYEYYNDTDVKNLVMGQSYSYRVIAFDSFLRESNSSSLMGVTVLPRSEYQPQAPQNLNAQLNLTGNKVLISWSPVRYFKNGNLIDEEGLWGYELYRSGPDIRDTETTAIALVRAVNYFVDNVDISTNGTFKYTVKAVHSSGAKSLLSKGVTVSRGLIEMPEENQISDAYNTPNAPHFLSITGPDINGYRIIDWEVPRINTDGTALSGGVSRYIIYKSLYYNGPYEVEGFSTANSYAFYGSTAQYYFYRITAVDSFNRESPQSGTGFAGIELPNLNLLPTELQFELDKVNTVGGGFPKIALKWNASLLGENIVQYYIYRSLYSNGPFHYLDAITHTGPGMSYTDQGYYPNGTGKLGAILADQTYYYRITAIDSAGESGPSYYVAGKASEAEGLSYRFASYGIHDYTGDQLNVIGLGTDTDQNSCRLFTTEATLGGTGKFVQFRFPVSLTTANSGNYEIKLYSEVRNQSAPNNEQEFSFNLYFANSLNNPDTTNSANIQNVRINKGARNTVLATDENIMGTVNFSSSFLSQTNKYIFIRIFGTENSAATYGNSKIFLNKVVFTLK